MDKKEKISLLISIFEKLWLDRNDINENQKILEQKNDEELLNILENLWNIISKQKNIDNNLIQKIRKIGINFDENIDNLSEKINIDKNINF